MNNFVRLIRRKKQTEDINVVVCMNQSENEFQETEKENLKSSFPSINSF